LFPQRKVLKPSKKSNTCKYKISRNHIPKYSRGKVLC
jgi:hypothetical protein